MEKLTEDGGLRSGRHEHDWRAFYGWGLKGEKAGDHLRFSICLKDSFNGNSGRDITSKGEMLQAHWWREK